MRTAFTPEQLADPAVATADTIFRKCVHCGFCTATCPTYVTLGNELDSPRGRVYLIKEMLESGKAPSERVVKHLDRCLTCLSCTSTCPSGVDYARLLELARERVEKTVPRPLGERLLRGLLLRVLPEPGLFRLSLRGAGLVRGLAGLLPGRLRGMVESAPGTLPAPSPLDAPAVHPALGGRKKRVVLMTGCAQKVLRPAINESTIRLLTRLGCEVIVAEGGGCCGALPHHLGRRDEAQKRARANLDAWDRLGDVDAVVINASGCGTTVKDYGHLLPDDPRAARFAALARDVAEVLAEIDFAPGDIPRPVVAYHAACSLQHGQKIKDAPKALLKRAGFEVVEPRESHLCCGSAGTYSLLQPEISQALKTRKVTNLKVLGAGVVATGNIGCLSHLAPDLGVPVVHTVELVDWATGGPVPQGISA